MKRPRLLKLDKTNADQDSPEHICYDKRSGIAYDVGVICVDLAR